MSVLEISDDLFCGRTGFCDAAISNGCEELSCGECHRKWPTHVQFEKEYGKKWKGACYYFTNNEHWADAISWAPADVITSVVCACTPFGKPNDNWRVK